jgi:hypothetical protein
MHKNRAVVVGALAALALGGCFGVPLSRSQVEETLQTTAIEVGLADRTQVRQTVGQPLLSSDYWRFDVFQISDWNRGVLFIGYIPLPQWEKNEGFVLVTYGDDGRVADVAFGHRAKGFWFLTSTNTEIAVEFGDLRLWTSDEQLYLAANPKLRDEYLSRPVSEGSCRVVLGSERREYPVRVHVDAASPVSDTGIVIGARSSQSLTVLTLKAGSHRIHAVPVVDPESIPAPVQFDCDSGATRYALLGVEWKGESGAMFRRLRYWAVVEIMNEIPPVFDPQPLLIWGNGAWVVEQEPQDGAQQGR